MLRLLPWASALLPAVTVRSQTVRRCVTNAVYGHDMYKMIAFSALAALCVAGCNKKKEEGGSTAAMTKEDKGPAKAPESGGAVTINGSGSTFQKPYQEV